MRTIRRTGAVAALVVAAALGGIAVERSGGGSAAVAQGLGTASAEELRYRLDVLDAELAELRARLGGGAQGRSAPAGIAGALSNSAVAELERELRRLTADVEELQNRQRRIAEEAARRFSDIEFRLTELEGGDISTLQPVPPLGGVGAGPEPAPTPGSATGPASGTAAQGTPGPAAGAMGQAGGGAAASGGIVPGPAGQGSFPGIALPSGQAGEQVAAAGTGERAQFELAVEDVRQGRFDQGEERLQRLLRDSPGSPLAPNAWYWLGESQATRGNHAAAASSFLNGYKADQQGPRAPHNLYRLGVSLGRLGQVNEACLTLRQVRSRFPGAPDRVVERADEEADRLTCG